MSKKNPRLFDALHIKRFTKGTSNELSLSVLDAAVDARDNKKGEPAISNMVSGLSSQSSRSAKSSAPTTIETSSACVVLSETTSAPDETFDQCIDEFTKQVKTRKRKRRKERVLAIALSIVLLATLIFVGTTFAYGEYQNYQKYSAVLEECLAETSGTDEVFIELDGLINNPLGENAQTDVTNLKTKLLDTKNILFNAQMKGQQAANGLREARAQSQATQAVEAINNRLTMLEAGQELLDDIEGANKAVESLNKAWDEMMSGDTKAREAANLVVSATPENIQASLDTNKEALELFSQAKVDIEAAEQQYTKAEFSKLKDYLEKRIEATGYAIASDQALIDKNKEEAQAQNDLYSTADEEAANMAMDIPENVNALLKKKYEENTKEQRAQYDQAKSKV